MQQVIKPFSLGCIILPSELVQWGTAFSWALSVAVGEAHDGGAIHVQVQAPPWHHMPSPRPPGYA